MNFNKLIIAGVLLLGATGCSSRAMNDYGYNENGIKMKNSIRDTRKDYYNDYSYNNTYSNYTDDSKILGRSYPKKNHTNSRLKANIRETVNDNKIYDVNRNNLTVGRDTTRVTNKNTNSGTISDMTNSTSKLKNNINNTVSDMTRTNTNGRNLKNDVKNSISNYNNTTRNMKTSRVTDTADYLTDNDYTLRNADFNYYTNNDGTKTVVEKNYKASNMPLTYGTNSALMQLADSKVGFKGIGFKGIYK